MYLAILISVITITTTGGVNSNCPPVPQLSDPDYSDPCISSREMEAGMRLFNNTAETTGCDRNLIEGWYKFIVNGAPAKIPNVCIKNQHCGTRLPLRVVEPDTAIAVNVTVCVDVCTSYEILGRWDCCVLRQKALIKNCTTHFAYYLRPTDRCPVGYCVQEMSVNPASPTTAKTGNDVLPADRYNVTVTASSTVVPATTMPTGPLHAGCRDQPFNCSGNRTCCHGNNNQTLIACLEDHSKYVGKCNNLPECEDESDESNCDISSCLEGGMVCPNERICYTRCDGNTDCQDGSDEAGCQRSITSNNVTFSMNVSRYDYNDTKERLQNESRFNADLRTAILDILNQQLQETDSTEVLVRQARDVNQSVTVDCSINSTMTREQLQAIFNNDSIVEGLLQKLFGFQDVQADTTTMTMVSTTGEGTNSNETTQNTINLTDTTETGVTTTDSLVSTEGLTAEMENTSSTPTFSNGTTIQSPDTTTGEPEQTTVGLTESITNFQSSTVMQSDSSTSISVSEVTTSDLSAGNLTTSKQTIQELTTPNPTSQMTESATSTLPSAPTTTGFNITTVEEPTTSVTSDLETSVSSTPDETTPTFREPSGIPSLDPGSLETSETTIVPSQKASTLQTTTILLTSASTHLQSTTMTLKPFSASTTSMDASSEATSSTAATTLESNIHTTIATSSPTSRTSQNLTETLSMAQTTPVSSSTIAVSEPPERSSKVTAASTMASTQAMTTPLVEETSDTASTMASTQVMTTPLVEETSETITHSAEVTTQSTTALETDSTIKVTTHTIHSSTLPETTQTIKTSTASRVSTSRVRSTTDISSGTFPVTDVSPPISSNASVDNTTVPGTSDTGVGNLIQENAGLFIFLIVLACVIIGICLFGLIGYIYQTRMRTWYPKKTYQDAYSDMEKKTLSARKATPVVGYSSPIPDIDIMQDERSNEQETSLSLASTSECPRTPVNGQESDYHGEMTPATGSGQPEVGTANHYDNLNADGIVPIEEIDKLYPTIPWIEAAEDTKL